MRTISRTLPSYKLRRTLRKKKKVSLVLITFSSHSLSATHALDILLSFILPGVEEDGWDQVGVVRASSWVDRFSFTHGEDEEGTGRVGLKERGPGKLFGVWGWGAGLEKFPGIVRWAGNLKEGPKHGFAKGLKDY